jgi:uncharacterized membrane protein
MPNGAQAHLLLNHIPVFGTAFGLLLLLAAFALRTEEWKRAALLVLLASALGTIPAYLSGEPAEEVIEHIEGVSHDSIEEHEEAALYGMIGVEALGALALLGLWLSRGGRPLPSGMAVGALVLGLLTMAAIAQTAHLGGFIRHPEIRPGFTAPAE